MMDGQGMEPTPTLNSPIPEVDLASSKSGLTPSLSELEPTPPSSSRPGLTLSLSEPELTPPSSSRPGLTLSLSEPELTPPSSSRPGLTPSLSELEPTPPSSSRPGLTPSLSELEPTPPSSSRPGLTPSSSEPELTPPSSSSRPGLTPSSSEPEPTPPSSSRPGLTPSLSELEPTPPSSRPGLTPSLSEPEPTPPSSRPGFTPISKFSHKDTELFQCTPLLSGDYDIEGHIGIDDDGLASPMEPSSFIRPSLLKPRQLDFTPVKQLPLPNDHSLVVLVKPTQKKASDANQSLEESFPPIEMGSASDAINNKMAIQAAVVPNQSLSHDLKEFDWFNSSYKRKNGMLNPYEVYLEKEVGSLLKDSNTLDDEAKESLKIVFKSLQDALSMSRIVNHEGISYNEISLGIELLRSHLQAQHKEIEYKLFEDVCLHIWIRPLFEGISVQAKVLIYEDYGNEIHECDIQWVNDLNNSLKNFYNKLPEANQYTLPENVRENAFSKLLFKLQSSLQDNEASVEVIESTVFQDLVKLYQAEENSISNLFVCIAEDLTTLFENFMQSKQACDLTNESDLDSSYSDDKQEKVEVGSSLLSKSKPSKSKPGKSNLKRKKQVMFYDPAEGRLHTTLEDPPESKRSRANQPLGTPVVKRFQISLPCDEEEEIDTIGPENQSNRSQPSSRSQLSSNSTQASFNELLKSCTNGKHEVSMLSSKFNKVALSFMLAGLLVATVASFVTVGFALFSHGIGVAFFGSLHLSGFFNAIMGSLHGVIACYLIAASLSVVGLGTMLLNAFKLYPKAELSVACSTLASVRGLDIGSSQEATDANVELPVVYQGQVFARDSLSDSTLSSQLDPVFKPWDDELKEPSQDMEVVDCHKILTLSQ